MEGRITKQISNQYKVTVNGVDYICSARGKFRNLGLSPLVGDIVRISTRIELTGKGSDRFCTAGKVGPCGFGKNHPRFAPVFFPKTLPCRKRPLHRPYSSKGLPKSRVSTIK